ncbi:ABC transporter permease [Janibacter anophelis]|uniref:ABC transporter permease n=1 Tax=Janibacter anophelis TaxID=319054 RepID=UPI00083351B6|nr:ABC transporter permease [Janibacter anophelis]
MRGWGVALVEGLEAIVRRPGRSVLTALSVSVGVIAFVATLGVAGNGARAVSVRFDELAARSVILEGWDQTAVPEPNGLQRLDALPGVDGAARFAPVTDAPTLALHPRAAEQPVEAVVMDGPSSQIAVQARVTAGRWWDPGHLDRCDDVVVIGDEVAARMGLGTRSVGSTVWLDGHPYALLGIATSPITEPAISSQVVIPRGAECESLGMEVGPTAVRVSAAPGAAHAVAEAAPLALSPVLAQSITARTELEPRGLRTLVLGESQRLMIALAALALAISVVIIAVTLWASIAERRTELGLRRAIGASRGDIVRQIMAESTVLGLIGAIHGVLIGSIVTLNHSITLEVRGDLPWPWLGAALLAGILSGAVGGVIPAVRASRVDPAIALTSG